MSYTLKDNELALVLKPVMEGSKFTGSIIAGIAMGEQDVTTEITNALLETATLMSAFIDVAHENEELLDLVFDRRDYLMRSIMEQDQLLTFSSETMGSA